LAQIEPAVLTRLGRIDPAATGWQRARAALAETLAREGRGAPDLVLRWLASFLLSPADRAAIVADVHVLLAGLPVLQAPEVARPA
jgi:hypothetical protein